MLWSDVIRHQEQRIYSDIRPSISRLANFGILPSTSTTHPTTRTKVIDNIAASFLDNDPTIIRNATKSRHEPTTPPGPVPPSVMETSPLSDSRTALLDRIERVLTCPTDFHPTTPEDLLAPLLAELSVHEDDDGAIARVEEWCRHLGDAVRAAESRDTIRGFLAEVESWEDWRWDLERAYVDEKKGRIEEICQILARLPIEWLKGRVTGIHSKRWSIDYHG